MLVSEGIGEQGLLSLSSLSDTVSSLEAFSLLDNSCETISLADLSCLKSLLLVRCSSNGISLLWLLPLAVAILALGVPGRHVVTRGNASSGARLLFS